MGAPARIRQLLTGLPRYLQLMLRLVADPRVSRADKALLAAAVVYAVTPFDMIPDLLAVVGRLDDLFLLALTMDRLVARAGPELVRQHWEGPEELLLSLRASVDQLARRLPAGVRRKLTRRAEGR